MKKMETVERTIEDYRVAEIGCNKCGKLDKVYDNEDVDFSVNEYQTFNASFGYGSRYDMESWQFDLCEDCLTDLIKSFKYSPSGFGQEQYLAHDEQAMFDKWKETGEVDLEAGMTKEEIDARGGSIYMDWEDEGDDSGR